MYTLITLAYSKMHILERILEERDVVLRFECHVLNIASREHSLVKMRFSSGVWSKGINQLLSHLQRPCLVTTTCFMRDPHLKVMAMEI